MNPLKVMLVDDAEPQDINRFVRAMQRKSEALGRECWLPPIADCAAVFEVVRGSEFVGGMVVMPVHELIVAGDNAMIMRALIEHSGRMREVLRRRDISNLIGFVPNELVEGRKGMLRLMKRAGLGPVTTVTAFESSI